MHVVLCDEEWLEIRSRTGQPIRPANVFIRCSKLARGSWSLENNILTKKRRGYNLEHAFSYDWQAMKGFHMLLKTTHCPCQLLEHNEMFIEAIRERGVQGFYHWLLHILDAFLYGKESIDSFRDSRKQWRLCPVI